MRYFDDRRHASLADLWDDTLGVVHDSVMCDGISVFELSESRHELEFAATKTIARDLLQGLELSLGTGVAGRAALSRRSIVSNDVHAHPDFYALPDHQLKFETQAVLCCPMRHEGEVVGVVELVNKTDDTPFSDAERASAQALADGAAPHWRSEAEAGRRESFHNLGAMVRKIVDVEGLSVFTLDREREKLVLRFSDTSRKTRLRGAKLDLDQGVAGWVARQGQALLVEDVHDEPRFFAGVDAISMFATRSIAAAPVIYASQVLAVLEIVNARGSGPLTQDDLAVLREIANELAERIIALR